MEPTADGGCTLTLVNVLEARDTAARNGAGWVMCLDALAAHLDGSTAAEEPWQPHYEAAVAAGLPFGAPVPGQ